MQTGFPEVLPIEQVIGPRLERKAIVIETATAAGRVALRLSVSAAVDLRRALAMALIAVRGPELPEFLTETQTETSGRRPSRTSTLRHLRAARTDRSVA